MKKSLALVFAFMSLCLVASGRAQTMSMTGGWIRESVSVATGAGATGRGANVDWGPEFTAIHDARKLTIHIRTPRRVVTRQYQLNGVDVIEKIHAHCPDYDGFATNAAWKDQDKVLVITETAVRPSCLGAHGVGAQAFGAHGLVKNYFGADQLLGPRADLQSVTTVSLSSAETLTVQFVQIPAKITTEATYRRKQ